jgi:hypothetical protein
VELIRHWKKIYACNGFSTGLLRLKTGGDGKSRMYGRNLSYKRKGEQEYSPF